MPRKLDGSFIQTGSITTTQLSSAVTQVIEAGGGPRVTSLIYPGNDTAGNTVGGQTVYINGSGFETNNAIYINGNAVPSKSFISASNLSFTTPALSAGIYPVYVINTDTGATAIFVPGYISSAEPAWVTGSSLSEVGASDAWSISLSATGDAPITYALANGSSLPSGINLAANGLISGTLSSPPESDTQYTFTVVATDAQNQDASRQFTITTSVGEGLPFANNVLLIHADGTNNGNNHSFLDSSNNNFTITRNGNATQGSFSPFSQTGWSNLFDGVDDNLSVSAGSGSWADFGSGEFTIEAWIFPRTVSTLQGICGTHTGGTNTWQFRLNNATLEIFGGASGGTAYAGGSVAANTWTHVAACRSGTNVYVFVNGILTTRSVGSSDTFPAGTNVTIGNLYSSPSAYWFNGYISNLRILKGTAQYTSNFTPPISALTAVSNTQLLTCQSNRFIDNSTNAFTITRNGDVSIQSWSPFAPTAAYSTANVGGSGYFDGSGDRLTLPSSSNLAFGTGDFCVELWAYFNANPASMMFITNISDADTQFAFRVDASGYPKVQGWFSNFAISSATVVANQWYHLVACRVSNTLSIFINGTRTATATVSNNFSSTNAFTIGGPSNDFSGFMSGLRITKGSSPYDATQSSITVPTTPVTAIANTQLLLNFTNAGIFDQTAKNVLETVGDAKVSTAQYKYGTGSMYFDGTGDNITIPSSPNLDFGTGDFTIELWANFSALSTNRILLDKWASGNANSWQLYWRASGTSITFLVGASTVLLQDPSTSRITTNTWYHIAVTRSGSTNRLFIDGVEVASATDLTNLTNTNRLCIGEQLSTLTNDLNGYIDDLRITKGYARYTSNFTPPTSALKDK